MTERTLEELAEILRRRVQIISDLELREKNPDEHLRQLQEVFGEIAQKHQALVVEEELHPRLGHFLQNGSFQKALDWIEDRLGKME